MTLNIPYDVIPQYGVSIKCNFFSFLPLKPSYNQSVWLIHLFEKMKTSYIKALGAAFVPVFLFLTSFGPAASVDNFNYEVFVDGRPVGSYKVDRTELNGTTNFRVENSTAVGLIRKSEQKFVMLTSFDHSRFVSSDMKTWVGEALESSTVIHWDGNKYVRQEGEKLTEIPGSMSTFSSPCMFFEEPMSRTSLFYEKYGMELPVVDLGNHRYEVKLPNGGKECYTYKDGQVVQMDLIQTFTTITLKANS